MYVFLQITTGYYMLLYTVLLCLLLVINIFLRANFVFMFPGHLVVVATVCSLAIIYVRSPGYYVLQLQGYYYTQLSGSCKHSSFNYLVLSFRNNDIHSSICITASIGQK